MTSEAAVGSLRVLIVEDEPLIRWAVAETLTEAGHKVLEANDAATTLRLLNTSASIDVVLLDFRLPDCDDLSLVERIRQQTPSSAVVMMTAFGTPQMTDDAKRLGVYEIIAKPFDVEAVAGLLAEAHRSKTS
jgi:two-component system response regulator PilR (NtrC family)